MIGDKATTGINIMMISILTQTLPMSWRILDFLKGVGSMESHLGDTKTITQGEEEIPTDGVEIIHLGKILELMASEMEMLGIQQMYPGTVANQLTMDKLKMKVYLILKKMEGLKRKMEYLKRKLMKCIRM